MRIDPTEIPTAKLHGYLLGSVAPRPIALVSTIDEDGNRNLSPFSFFNVFSANPPIAIFSPARRVRNNTTKHTLDNCLNNGECVINVVNYNMSQQMILSSTEYPQGVDEFVKAGFSPIPSETVNPWRVEESPVQMECKVKEVLPMGDGGGAGNLVICKITLIHINDSVLNQDGTIDQHSLDLVSRLGANWYGRATGTSLFEVPKPLTTLGIGVDSLPKNIRESHVLTGNDLAQLASVNAIPTKKGAGNDHGLNPDQLHQKAQELIGQGELDKAWQILLS